MDELLFIDMGSGQNRIVSLSTEDAETNTAFEDVVRYLYSADIDGDGNIDAAGAGTPIRSISSVFLNLSREFSNQVVAPEDGVVINHL